MKAPYICGPLTWLPTEQQEAVKQFYVKLGDVCEFAIGVRAFVPHEHYDPINMPHFTPTEVDAAERRIVCYETSVLIVVAIAPSWGGGIEVEMANRHNVPAILLYGLDQYAAGLIPRLLRGNPAIKKSIAYLSQAQAVNNLGAELQKMFPELARR